MSRKILCKGKRSHTMHATPVKIRVMIPGVKGIAPTWPNILVGCARATPDESPSALAKDHARSQLLPDASL
jgi:hypothetical protein